MMRKSQLFLISGAILLFIALSFMPKFVVDNEGGQVGEMSAVPTEEEKEEHVALPALVRVTLDSLQELYSSAQSEEKQGLAVTEIIAKFVEHNKIDSAAVYAEKFADAYPSWEASKVAADLYYDAFTYAISDEKAKRMGGKAEIMYNALLTEQPDSANLRVKIGMIKVSSQMPMQGVLMIREVFEQNPQNQLATYYLGMLAIRSKQYDKAIEKFIHLKKINPQSVEADYYLGISYFEAGKKEEARKVFEKMKANSQDPNILQAIQGYLGELDK